MSRVADDLRSLGWDARDTHVRIGGAIHRAVVIEDQAARELHAQRQIAEVIRPHGGDYEPTADGLLIARADHLDEAREQEGCNP